MTAPNMAAITESLERSFQNCSLNHHRTGTLPAAAAAAASTERSSSSDFSDQSHNPLIHSSSSSSSDSTVELNSHVSMPYDWEQCLDLKTGEIYYMNWKNGMRAKHDPRLMLTQDLLMSRDHDYNNYNYYYSDGDDDSSSCDSTEESSSESSPCSSRDNFNNSSMIKIVEDEDVLVVAGCKRCLMYYMLPKKVDNCPQCRASHLIHFDRSSDNNNNNA